MHPCDTKILLSDEHSNRYAVSCSKLGISRDAPVSRKSNFFCLLTGKKGSKIQGKAFRTSRIEREILAGRRSHFWKDARCTN